MDGLGCTQQSHQGGVGDDKQLTWKDGLRLVDMYELAKQMHCKTCSSLLDLNNIKNETRWGLASVLSVLCCCCQTLNDVYTGKMNVTADGKSEFEVNVKTSVNMLLCGMAGEHVVNFLAVLNIPQPLSYDTSITTITSLSNCPPGTSQPRPSKEMATSASPVSCSTSQSSPSTNTTPAQNTVCDHQITPSPVVLAERIKTEGDEQLSENFKNKTQQRTCTISKTCLKLVKEDLKTSRGRKRKSEDSSVSAVDNTVAEDEETDDGYFDDVHSFQKKLEVEASVEKEKAVQKKRYRCPVCGRVLPSSRGFHIHVVRKHQASNLQAVHHELGPNDLVSLDAKENSSRDAKASHAQPSASTISNPTLSLPQAKMKTSASAKNSAHPSSRTNDRSTTETQQTDGYFDTENDSSQLEVSRSRKSGRVSKKLRSSKAADCSVACQVQDCHQTFKTDVLYQKHLQKAHGTKSPFACPQCPKQYSSQKSLNIHMTVAHCSKDERKAVCKYCGDTVQHRRALKKHIKACHPRGVKKTFYCDECPMTFCQPSALKYHKLRHAGIKNYQCFYCDKKFSGSGNRLNHMRYFHEKERKFLCDTCGMGFFRAYALREHERVHSGEKPYQCERCAERFTKKEYLTIHMRTHTGEKPYKCELCDKAFTQRTSRSIHRRKVHGMKKQEPAGSAAQKEVVVNNKIVFVNAGFSYGSQGVDDGDAQRWPTLEKLP